MEHSLRRGLSFGLTSGVITTLGLMIGLYAGTHSRAVVMGGILTIAIADAFSDALGIHVSEETVETYTTRGIWLATFSTFFSKFIFALTFLIPLFFLPLGMAVGVSVGYGMLLLGVTSYFIAKTGKSDHPWGVVVEHLFIGGLVVLATHFVGGWIRTHFPS